MAKDLFAWHDKSLILVLLLNCRKRNCSALCRSWKNSGLKEDTFEKQRIHQITYTQVLQMYITSPFLAKEGNAQRNCKSMLFFKKKSKDRYFTVLSLLKALHCKY